MHQILDVRRPDIEQFNPAADLLSQTGPIEFEERVVPRDRSNDFVRDVRPLPETRKMQLLHFSTTAHVVHQEVRVAFSSNESHNRLSLSGRPNNRRSVSAIHYAVNGTITKLVKKLHRIGY